MPLAPRYRALLTGTAGAASVAGVIAFTTVIPYAVAAGVVLFAWPVTGFLIDLIQSRNPHYAKMVPAYRGWRIFAGWLGGLGLVCSTVAYTQHMGFWLLYCGGFLILAFGGAVNGLVMELEDNAKGGWLNP
jgi:hypothetical protein